MTEEVIQGYREISPEDQKKAKVFFDRGRTVADTGNYEYAIEMFLQGLGIDPDAVEAHKTLREISLKRKASGGKSMGIFEKMKMGRAKEDKQAMLNAEKLLAYDPGNTDYMVNLMQAAHRAGFFDTVMWIAAELMKANQSAKSPELGKFIILKDTYKSLKRYRLANEACQQAVYLKPDDMDLGSELKRLAAQQTTQEGNYEEGDFRKSIKDMEKQQNLIEQDKDVRTVDSLQRSVMQAEEEYQREPNEPGKLQKLVDALLLSKEAGNESRAMQLLDQAHQKTKQFRFRFQRGKIEMAQLVRQDRELRRQLKASPQDEALKQKYGQFLRQMVEKELSEYTLFAENYPTDMQWKLEMAKRLYYLKRFDESIPVFQQARNDPKLRVDATILLGRAFLDAGFMDEAIDTFKVMIEEYELRGDEKSKEMHYWYGRALEQKGEDTVLAIKNYSQVAQWDFNYRDVQQRIKKLRAAVTTQNGGNGGNEG